MEKQTVGDWLSDLAARTPAPGGGAAAALSAAASAALIGMVANYTTGKKWISRERQMIQLVQQAEALREQALSFAADDAAAFKKVGNAYKLPAESDQDKANKKKAVQAALAGAADVPKKVAEMSKTLVEICRELVETSNPNVISDVAVAASMAGAAAQSAIVNIEINQQLLHDETLKMSYSTAIHDASNTVNNANMIVRLVREKLVKDTA